MTPQRLRGIASEVLAAIFQSFRHVHLPMLKLFCPCASSCINSGKLSCLALYRRAPCSSCHILFLHIKHAASIWFCGHNGVASGPTNPECQIRETHIPIASPMGLIRKAFGLKGCRTCRYPHCVRSAVCHWATHTIGRPVIGCVAMQQAHEDSAGVRHLKEHGR